MDSHRQHIHLINCCCFICKTGLARPFGANHVHDFQIQNFRGTTSEAIFFPNGCHVHLIDRACLPHNCHFVTSFEVPVRI